MAIGNSDFAECPLQIFSAEWNPLNCGRIEQSPFKPPKKDSGEFLQLFNILFVEFCAVVAFLDY